MSCQPTRWKWFHFVGVTVAVDWTSSTLRCSGRTVKAIFLGRDDDVQEMSCFLRKKSPQVLDEWSSSAGNRRGAPSAWPRVTATDPSASPPSCWHRPHPRQPRWGEQSDRRGKEKTRCLQHQGDRENEELLLKWEPSLLHL